MSSTTYKPLSNVREFTIPANSHIEISADEFKSLAQYAFAHESHDVSGVTYENNWVFFRLISGEFSDDFTVVTLYNSGASTSGGLFWNATIAQTEGSLRIDSDAYDYEKEANTECIGWWNYHDEDVTWIYIYNNTSTDITFAMTNIRKVNNYKVMLGQGVKIQGNDADRCTAVTYNGIGGNFSAVDSPITAESYQTLIDNAKEVADKSITISNASAKLISEYCKYRGKQTKNLAYGGTFSGTVNGVTISYDNGTFTLNGTATEQIVDNNTIFQHTFALGVGNYAVSPITITDYRNKFVARLWNENGDKQYIEKTTTTLSVTNESNWYIGIYIASGTVFSNTKINVQLELGTTATEWVAPLTTMTTIADANAKGFKIKTQTQTTNKAYSGSYSGSVLGVSVSYDAGAFTLIGTATSSGGWNALIYRQYVTLDAGTYTISGDYADGFVLANSDNAMVLSTNGTATATLEAGTYYIGVRVVSGTTYNGNYRVQLSSGGTSLDWQTSKTASYELLPSLSFNQHYVDTQVQPTQDTEIEIDCKPRVDNYLYGASNGTNLFACCARTNATTFSYNTTSQNASFVSKEVRAIYAEKANLMYINGTLTNTFTKVDFSINKNLYIGCFNGASGIQYYAYIIFYSAVLNGELLIPANNGVTNGLLNLSTKQFLPLQ